MPDGASPTAPRRSSTSWRRPRRSCRPRPTPPWAGSWSRRSRPPPSRSRPRWRTARRPSRSHVRAAADRARRRDPPGAERRGRHRAHRRLDGKGPRAVARRAGVLPPPARPARPRRPGHAPHVASGPGRRPAAAPGGAVDGGPAREPSRQAVERLLDTVGGARPVPWEFEGLHTILSLVARGSASPPCGARAGRRRPGRGGAAHPRVHARPRGVRGDPVRERAEAVGRGHPARHLRRRPGRPAAPPED